MRIYSTFKEATNEIARDLKEMGIKIHTKTYQNKFIGDNKDFETLELQNYIYMVTQPKAEDLQPVQPWADAEWRERLWGAMGGSLNPGEAWKERSEVWEQFLNEDGKFCYTYADRFSRDNQVQNVIEQIKRDPDSRQLFITLWESEDSTKIGGKNRVPCTLGYLLQVRSNRVDITYLMRSSDFATHFQNDLFLAHRLQQYIATETGYGVGFFTHWIGSLHVFAKDVKEVF